MKKSHLLSAVRICVFTIVSANTSAGLIDRGGGLIYDTDRNITWLANAYYAGTNMGYSSAENWTNNLTYYDSVRGVIYDDWRLPFRGEMNHLFISELGGMTDVPISMWNNGNVSMFQNINDDYYWVFSVYNEGYYFAFTTGREYQHCCDPTIRAWAVRNGDVGLVGALDSDNDGILNNIEDPNSNGVVDAGETDPLNSDSDGDGLLDGEEDTNSNGIVDIGESDPLDIDTDDDGLHDSYEVNILASDPTSPTTVYTNPGDMNGDGEVNVGDLILLQREILGL